MARHPRQSMLRRLRGEQLESRLLLANDLPFHNPGLAYDVNNDLQVTALDALQIINFMDRSEDPLSLPDSNPGVNFPDANGSGGVTGHDALMIVNRLGPNGPALLAGRLVHDSSPGGAENVDFITNDFRLEFGTTRVSEPHDVLLRFNGQGPFVVAGSVSDEGSLALSELELSILSSGAISQGFNTVEAKLEGIPSLIDFAVTIDKSAPLIGDVKLGFESDTGFSHFDGVTGLNSPRFEGMAEENSAVSLFVNGQLKGETNAAGGVWELSAGVFGDGVHTAVAIATDVAGNVSVSEDFEFEIDTTAPIVPLFEFLNGGIIETPSGPVIESEFVTIGGKTTPRVELVLHTNIQTYLNTAENSGDFTFHDVELEFGENSLTLLAIDLAGNQSSFSDNIAYIDTALKEL